MPRIDLWAIETCQQIDESDESSIHQQLSSKGEDSSRNADQSSHEMGNSYTIVRTASHAWSSFVEQVESLCVSTSLMIMVCIFCDCSIFGIGVSLQLCIVLSFCLHSGLITLFSSH